MFSMESGHQLNPSGVQIIRKGKTFNSLFTITFIEESFDIEALP